MDKVTLTFTQAEMLQLCDESTYFVALVVQRLIDLQKLSNPEEILLDSLKQYVKKTFRPVDQKITAFKYVRQWAMDNFRQLSLTKQTELESLIGAKKFVESVLGQW